MGSNELESCERLNLHATTHPDQERRIAGATPRGERLSRGARGVPGVRVERLGHGPRGAPEATPRAVRSGVGQNALSPVSVWPRISEWMSCVPSYV